jgi:hypothetical protein
VPGYSRSDAPPYPGTVLIMAKAQKRGNRELKKPKMVKAPQATTDALFGKAVLDSIAPHKKKH